MTRLNNLNKINEDDDNHFSGIVVNYQGEKINNIAKKDEDQKLKKDNFICNISNIFNCFK